ncbi:MAG: response regulator, partial [Bilophila sp.]
MNRLSPAEPAVPFTSALLLVRHEDLAVVDRRALREAGIRSVRVLSSGVEAARILHTAATESAKLEMTFRDDPNLVLCHEQLADMTGDEFVRLIRLHPLLMPFPILMAVASDTTAIRAKATESGYSG